MGRSHPGDVALDHRGCPASEIGSDAFTLPVTAKAAADLILMSQQPSTKSRRIGAHACPGPGLTAEARIDFTKPSPPMSQVLAEMGYEEDEPEGFVGSTGPHMEDGCTLGIE